MEITVFKADYFDKFQCLAENCQINCCNYNWKITIDKDTYHKYKKFSSFGKKVNSDFSRLLRNSVEKDKKSKNNENFAYIKHIVNNKAFILSSDAYKSTEFRCPLSSNNNLCELQIEFGDEILSKSCKTFPRNYNKIFDEYEFTLSTQCEQVCKLLYDTKEPLKFRKVKLNNDANLKISNCIDDQLLHFNPVLKQFHIIRATCIKILQSREFSIDDRIILIGLLLSKLTSMNMDNDDKIRKYVKSFLASQQEYLEYFHIKIKKDTQIVNNDKILQAHEILFDSINFDDIELAYNEKKLLIGVKNNLKVYYKNYSMLQKKAKPMLKELEYFFENIFVNLIVEKSFPFNTEFDNSNGYVKKIDFMDNYIVFAWLYISLKVMLTSGLTLEDKTKVNTLINLIVLHSREVVSSNEKLNEMLTNFKEIGLDSVSQLSILINSA